MPTNHYVQNQEKLMIQSREKDKYFQIASFSEKIGFIKIEGHIKY